jgi:hypothetical protein
MLVLAVLALLVLGALLGGAGMKRLGRVAGRAAGRWRPGVGVGAVLLTFAGLAILARGAWVVGLPLLVAAGVLALSARKRPAAKAVHSRMSEAEARSLLGVGPAATSTEIKTAYIRLMQRVHPDHGGAVGLASQLNAARERLLG